MERKVMVVFKRGIDPEIVGNYYRGLEQLTRMAEGLSSFEIQRCKAINGESGLNQVVENVIFPDVMTTWKFENETYLNKFITSKYHLDIARNYFKPAVGLRVVFNSHR